MIYDLPLQTLLCLTLELSQQQPGTRLITPGDLFRKFYKVPIESFMFQFQQEPRSLDILNAANCTGASPIEIICFGPGSPGGGRRELKFCHLFEYEHWAPPGAIF